MLPGRSASMASSTAFAIRPHIAFFTSVSFRVLSCALAIAFCTFPLAAFYRVSVPSTCWAVLIAFSVLVLLGCAVVCDSAPSFGSLTAFWPTEVWVLRDFPAVYRLSFSALGLAYEWAHLNRFLPKAG